MIGYSETIEVTGHLVIRGRRGWGSMSNGQYGSKAIQRGRIARATVKQPGRLERDEVCVKVKLVVPKVAFEPLNLTDAGLVHVPSGHILSPAFYTEPPDEDADSEDGES